MRGLFGSKDLAITEFGHALSQTIFSARNLTKLNLQYNVIVNVPTLEWKLRKIRKMYRIK
jgi:hypothetical protein